MYNFNRATNGRGGRRGGRRGSGGRGGRSLLSVTRTIPSNVSFAAFLPSFIFAARSPAPVVEVEEEYQEFYDEEEERNQMSGVPDVLSSSSSFSRPNFNCPISTTSSSFSQGLSVIPRGGDRAGVRVARRGRTGGRPGRGTICVNRGRGSVTSGRVRTAGFSRPVGPPGPIMVVQDVVPVVEQQNNVMEMVRRRLPPSCSVSVVNQVHFLFHEFVIFLF